MAKIYFRENGVRGTVISGPFRTMDEALRTVRASGLKARDVAFLRKEASGLVKVTPELEFAPIQRTG
jgi:hypothetical protein